MTTSTIDALIDKELEELRGGEKVTKKAAKKRAPKKEEPLFSKKKEPSGDAPKGTKKYSELFGAVPPTGTDWDVPVYAREDWGENEEFIPAVNDDYVFDHSTLEPLIISYIKNLKTLTVGPTGCGKTSVVEQIAARINQPYLRINGRADMDSDTLLGRPWVTDGSMDFMLGEMPKAAQAGFLIAFDEPWKTPSGIQMALQRFYERDGAFQLDDMPGDLADKIIHSDPRCRMFLSDNVVGTGDGAAQYGATLIQDGSTLNRMDVVIKMGYLSAKDEALLIKKAHPTLTDALASRMVKTFNLIRTNVDQGELSAAVSPRNLLTWADLAIELGDEKIAFIWSVLGRYSLPEELGTVKEHYRTVFGASL